MTTAAAKSAGRHQWVFTCSRVSTPPLS
jgi:hypothetical protein